MCCFKRGWGGGLGRAECAQLGVIPPRGRPTPHPIRLASWRVYRTLCRRELRQLRGCRYQVFNNFHPAITYPTEGFIIEFTCGLYQWWAQILKKIFIVLLYLLLGPYFMAKLAQLARTYWHTVFAPAKRKPCNVCVRKGRNVHNVCPSTKYPLFSTRATPSLFILHDPPPTRVCVRWVRKDVKLSTHVLNCGGGLLLMPKECKNPCRWD